ncbi:hypothetical protein O6H91_04G068800 [Diphasiastrum complanatum]|uniref:Uncharacterized protein n=1 Tax=Diphasiastrum complanatum TaxID=34168 RepID=A0ACC2DY00_DIPCM|nr:hypothetical protein O6H91_04G068800 [Diphasiastrum complanatum]
MALIIMRMGAALQASATIASAANSRQQARALIATQFSSHVCWDCISYVTHPTNFFCMKQHRRKGARKSFTENFLLRKKISFRRDSSKMPYLFSTSNISHRSFKKMAESSLSDVPNSSEASEAVEQQTVENDESQKLSEDNGAVASEPFPSGDFEFRKLKGWNKFLVKLKMMIALPWQRVKKGSVLRMKLSGQITEELQGRFAQGLSLPQICQNFIKAAHDPRVAGVYIEIEPLDCGWGKIDEICRHIEYYKKAGKFIIAYMAVAGEKEYYLACKCEELYVPPGAYITLLGLKVQATFLRGVLENIGVEPQIQRIGKYKSFGDTISRKDMSEANREMLTSILDDVFSNWLERVALSKGKSKEDVINLLEEGIFDVKKLKGGGWITDIKYEDEIEAMLKERLGQKGDKPLQSVDYKRYSRVKEWTLSLSGGKDKIAIIRAVGSISRARGGLNASGDGIVSDVLIEKIREVRESKSFKAVVLRIDSPGGDALASDLMWRELRLLAAKKPVIASMADVAASGGYYMAMAAGVIVAEKLTLTGSIGVVTGKFNLGQLYHKVGFTKEIISRGRFAELDADQRPFRPDEEDFFARSAQNAYKQFRDKAALSRSMEPERMEDVAQGRVWTGKAAKKRGLVDAIGGISRAVSIAKHKAGISNESKVTLVELSKRQPSLTTILRGGVNVFLACLGSEDGVKLFDVIKKGKILPERRLLGVQAHMGEILVEGLGVDESFKCLKDYSALWACTMLKEWLSCD